MPSGASEARVRRFVVVRPGSVEARESADPQAEIESILGAHWDSSDRLLWAHPGIRAFVRDGSIYDEAPTIWYGPAGGRAWPLCGTVVFSKLNLRSWGTLSRREVAYLLKVLTFGPDGLIRLSQDG